MTGWELQAPDEIKSYSFDWSDELETGEGIEESTWTIDPDLGPDTGAEFDVVLDSSDLVAIVTISGLTAGQSYQVKNIVETNEGRTLSREITIRCANK